MLTSIFFIQITKAIKLAKIEDVAICDILPISI